MSTVTAQIVLRFAAASEGPETTDALLRPLGLSSDLEPANALTQTVAAETYYELLERAAGPEDDALPLRYGASVRPEDFDTGTLALETRLGDAGLSAFKRWSGQTPRAFREVAAG